MLWVLNVAYLVAGLFYLPVLLYQMLVQNKNRHGWNERLGCPQIPPPSQPRVWVHAVSLGEVNATRLLVQRLQERCPDREIIVSTTTDTGYARASALYGTQRVFRFPLDFSWMARRVLERSGADLIVLMELEVWPNLIELADRRGTRVAVANGRLTRRSAGRFRWLGPVGRSMFNRLDWVGAQDAEIASRFISLGVPEERVTLTGSMKWDTAAVADTVDGAGELARALGIANDPPMLVCGSTGPGEEEIVLKAYKRLRESGRRIRLAIVPRKPERFEEVARLIATTKSGCLRRSEHPDGAAAPEENADRVILGDTMGELRKFYSLATVVFVGRSLVPMGGSDPMEAAALGKPLISGPHMDNFRQPCEALQDGRALSTVRSAGEMAETVGRICDQPAEAARAGEAARRVVIEHQGATDITVNALTKLLTPG